MNIVLIASLSFVLIALLIGYNVVLQQKRKIETRKRHEMAKYIAVIDSTEDLLGNAHNLPFSGALLMCLNNKIFDALRIMHQIDKTDKNITARMNDVQNQIEQVKQNYKNQESTAFRVPENDKDAISMLKLVKRLRAVIKSEHTKGRFPTQAFVAENARLEQMQMKINIENVIKRVTESRLQRQSGTALQLLNKALDVIEGKNDPYALSAKEKLQHIKADVEKELNDTFDANRPKSNHDDEDDIFTKKKKW